MRALFRLHRPRRAQSMVEFALIAPLLFLFILGIIEMGYALFVYTAVQNAAREGARAAAVRPCADSADTTAIEDATRARLPALVDTSAIDPDIEYSNGDAGTADFGEAVTVTIDYQFELLDPLTQTLIPQINVNAVASRSITTGCASVVPMVTSTPTSTPTEIPTETPGTPTETPGTPTATPTNTPTSTPTNTPGTPTNTPIPMCTVPSLIGTRVNDAASVWGGAGFTGSLSKSGGPGNWKITSQSLAAGSSQPCTSSITVYE